MFTHSIGKAIFSSSVLTLLFLLYHEFMEHSLSFTISRSTLKLMSIQSVMPSKHLITRCPLLLLPSIFPSIRVFSNESALYIR